MRKELGQCANAAIMLVGKYSEDDPHGVVRRKLKELRNERLAHRQTGATAIAEADPTAEEIESFYQDMSELIRLLLSLVMAVAYNPEDTAMFTATMPNSFGQACAASGLKVIRALEHPA
jgi:hypothetical protein